MVLWFRRRNEAARLAEVNGRLHRQLEAQELSYQDTLHSFMDIKRIIHDINKQLVYIRACIEAGHAAEGADHINGILQEIEASCNTITTGNLAVDALVSHAINIASDLNIAMQHKVQLSGAPVDIERYDLCIVLGNLLDNAIDAARQVRLKTEQIHSASYPFEQQCPRYLYWQLHCRSRQHSSAMPPGPSRTSRNRLK